MNTDLMKKIGNCMIVGGAMIFCGGIGLRGAAWSIEKHLLKERNEVEISKATQEAVKKKAILEEEALKERIAKDHLYSEKVKNMDNKEFARFHAEANARADQSVKEAADRAVKNAQNELAEVRLECNDKIAKIQEECLKKIEAAQKKADEATRKYEAIDTLFTNKNDILRAKAALEEAAADAAKSKKNKEDILKSLEGML